MAIADLHLDSKARQSLAQGNTMTKSTSIPTKILAAAFAMLIGAASAEAATITKIGGNHSNLTAQNLNGNFDLTPDANVLDSAFIPHVTINNAMGDNGFDWYSFTATAAGRLILDIDGGINAGAGSIDTMLHLFNSAGTRIASNDDFAMTAGGGGSIHAYDSFIDTMIGAGQYYVVVGEFWSESSGGPFGMSGNYPDAGDDYTLHVSLQNPAATSVPEPASALLFGLGLAGIAAIRRRHRRA
jgi:Bacterial pre-peptidase C-terminal domain/PEP-CTERM motif